MNIFPEILFSITMAILLSTIVYNIWQSTKKLCFCRVVDKYTQKHSDNSSTYYVTVVLPNRSTEKIKVSFTVYEDVEIGKSITVLF